MLFGVANVMVCLYRGLVSSARQANSHPASVYTVLPAQPNTQGYLMLNLTCIINAYFLCTRSVVRFLSMLYSHPEWPKIHPEVMKNEMREIFEDNWMMKLLFSVSWLINHLNIIQGKKERGQPVTFTDFFGYLIGDVLRIKVSIHPLLHGLCL